MRQFLSLLIILLASVWLGLQIIQNNGIAFFSYGPWSVRMPLWFLLVSFILFGGLLYGIIKIFHKIVYGFSHLILALKNRRQAKIEHENALLKSLDECTDLEDLQTRWCHLPWRLRKNPAFVTCYVKQLQEYPQAPQAAATAIKLIQNSLKKSYQASLVRIYGLLSSDQSLKQLIQAEKWLKKYPHESVLLLTLGRLAMRCELWGKARRYFTDSLAQEKNPEAYAEQGKLLEQLGEANAALRSYRAGSDLQWEQHSR